MKETITIGDMSIEVEMWEPGPGYTAVEIEAMRSKTGGTPRDKPGPQSNLEKLCTRGFL